MEGDEIPEHSELSIKRSKEIRKHLLENKPIKHEGVLAYSLERASGGGELFNKLRQLVRVGSINTDWMEKWYSQSICLVDPGYSDYTSKKLRNALGEMSEEQTTDLRGWSNQSDEDREVRLAEFSDLL